MVTLQECQWGPKSFLRQHGQSSARGFDIRLCGGCVRSFSPSGELLAQVDVAATLVTNCAFGGPDLSTLYITCAIPSYEDFVKGEEPLAGSLFKAEVGAKGRLQNNFLC